MRWGGSIFAVRNVDIKQIILQFPPDLGTKPQSWRRDKYRHGVVQERSAERGGGRKINVNNRVGHTEMTT